jgi:hypothetical protein
MWGPPLAKGVFISYWLIAANSDPTSWKCRVVRGPHTVDVLKSRYSTYSIVHILKGQCHEIFDPRFFHHLITPRPLINTLKYFRFLFRIRRSRESSATVPLTKLSCAMRHSAEPLSSAEQID